MAPTNKRSSIRARARASVASDKQKSTPTSHNPQTFPNDPPKLLAKRRAITKRDKRTLKHDSLMTRVRAAGVEKNSGPKRRRPAKKMAAAEGMAGQLANALPDVDAAWEDEDEWEGFGEKEGGSAKRRRRRAEGGDGKMVMRSLKNRPGAMKRKDRLQKAEVERFGRNLAQLTGHVNSGAGQGAEKNGGVAVDAKDAGQSNKWAALRNFISTTMEQDPAFKVS